jgi:GT2 family glycosyltransferase
MRPPELAIIVTSYQMPWHVRRVLESIAVQRTTRQIEVIIADDGSTDETPQVVRAFAEQAPFRVQFITHPHTEFHAARCRNDGARHSTAPHLLFTDGDCVLPPDHVEQHLRAARPGVVTCSYCVRLDHGVSQHLTLEAIRGGKFMQWAPADELNKLRQMHFKSICYSLIRHPTKPALRSTNFAMGRAEYERINGFDENFIGWGCEDDDFGRRLRAAGIRMSSILNRTCVYHLWHPPAPSRPREWKQGGNVAYLQRPIRLTSCVSGLTPRTPRDLTVRLADNISCDPRLIRLLETHGWVVDTSRGRTDLELLCCPGRGRFSSRTDCRVLACSDERQFDTVDSRAAQIVLSSTGRLGGEGQWRFRLDDVAGFWTALQGRGAFATRAAA